MSETESASNIPEISVTELSGALKRTIEDRFGFVRVRGEISGYRGPHSSGHVYFAIKDQGAKIDAVIWKGVFGKMKVRPEEGMEVVATGKVTTYPGKSTYQLIVESVAPAGVGALMALLEERRRKLAAEGLFDAARKRKIPYLPDVIGVITSPTGAVIRDILHRISGRFPRHVIVWPVRVQGETSAAEVTAAIAGFNALPAGGPIARPDVIIVARGGGSLEDLWGFNDEALVRAARASAIPLISAVGHETDWTLLDHAADLRAPTPTGAAEMCVPVRADLLGNIQDLARRARNGMTRSVERARSDLRAAARALPSGDDLVGVPRQQLDVLGTALRKDLRSILDARKLKLSACAAILQAHSPHARLSGDKATFSALAQRLTRARGVSRERRDERLTILHARLRAAQKSQQGLAAQQTLAARRSLESLAQRLAPAFQASLARRRQSLDGLHKMRLSLGYRNVLARGFALVRDAGRRPLRQAGSIAAGDRLHIELADGEISAVAGDGGPGAASGPRRAPALPRKDQGSLF